MGSKPFFRWNADEAGRDFISLYQYEDGPDDLPYYSEAIYVMLGNDYELSHIRLPHEIAVKMANIILDAEKRGWKP